MKAAFALILLIASAWAELPAFARGASGNLPSVEMFGKEYVRLSDWARANDFEVHWLKRDEGLQLTNRSARLAFALDSHDLRVAEINGAEVFLVYPVVLRSGLAYISALDLKTAIKPVLQPPHNWSGAKVKTIVIDPGHGGNDPGKEEGSHQEKKYTLLLAQELSDQLKRAGFNVSLTRMTDTRVELPERPDIARRRGADLFISLHWNSVETGRNEVKGVETYCLTPAGAPSTNARGELFGAGTKPGNLNNDQNMFLAYSVHKALLKNLDVEDHGVHRGRLSVLRTAEMPAILIEGGFMSNPAEAKRIYDPVYRKQMARAIVEGVQAYKATVEQPR
ncbi:MAG: Cell wall hydrolase/autolysin [Pedosphaera sp.]|nr:Cell wall hydrolase/autolysin [Pedosphaera sp.]